MYALMSLGATPSEELKRRTLDWAVRSGEVKLQDFFYAISSVAGSAAGSRLAWDYFKQVNLYKFAQFYTHYFIISSL